MPSRNITRQDVSDAYYHVYTRGISKGNIFLDPADKEYFLYLLSRHLSIKSATSKKGHAYRHFRGQVELLTYCLMDNHIHLLLYQADQGALSGLMRSVLIAYTTYFNRTYKRSGP